MKTTFLVLICILLISCMNKKENRTKESLEIKAKRIHENVITIDTHADINIANFTDSINYTQRLDNQVNLPKMEEGGLDVVWLIVYTGQDSLNINAYAKAKENAIAKFNAIHKLCKEIAPDKIEIALTSNDVKQIVAKGKKVAMIGVENAYPIGEDLSEFEHYYNLGARYISLSHNGHSQFCDSNTGEKDSIWLHNGLSELGKKAIIEMNRLGIMIDISHPSKEAILQMVALSKAPIIASHSSARALCNHSRNLDDEQLKLIKENGGVVQTVAFSSYLNTEKHKERTEYMEKIHRKIADSLGITWHERQEIKHLPETEKEIAMQYYLKVTEMAKAVVEKQTNAPKGADVTDLINHIDYMVNLIGIDHVGISSDFDGGGGIYGWSDASETFNVTLELVKKGYSETDIQKLWGGNLLRVLDKVQEVAKTIQHKN